MKNNKVGMLLVLMLFVGVCGLLYPSVSQYWNTKTQTQAVENYQEILDSLSHEDFEAFFEEAEGYNTKLSQLNSQLSDYHRLEGYNDILNVGENGIMGYVLIPKLGVELPLYHDVLHRSASTQKRSIFVPTSDSHLHLVRFDSQI